MWFNDALFKPKNCKTIYSWDYKVDVEYNRNKGGKLETITTDGTNSLNITCDLIVHSRGASKIQDNLIAIEMKKSTRTKKSRNKDRDRLKALTKSEFDDVWSYDGTCLPEHVCRYVLGIYYEINYNTRNIQIEYYKEGLLKKTYKVGY